MTAERLPQEALGPVAPDGAPELSAHGESQAIMTPVVGRRHQQEQRAVDPVPAAEGSLELGGGAQSLMGPEPRSCRDQPRLRSASVPSDGDA